MPTQKPFTIENFKELYANSDAARMLTLAEQIRVTRAIDEGDTVLLSKLYAVLTDEKSANKQIAADFNDAKNRIIDDYVVAATGIRKRYVEMPMKEKIAEAVREEKEVAEEILKKI